LLLNKSQVFLSIFLLFKLYLMFVIDYLIAGYIIDLYNTNNMCMKKSKKKVLHLTPKETLASESDPTGKYTGVPLGGWEPEQDVDDL